MKGAWWVVTHYRGKRRKKRFGPMSDEKRQAEEVAKKINAKLVLGEFAPSGRGKTLPFGEFAELWLRREVELPLEREMKGHLAPGTARACRLQLDVHLKPHFKDVELRSIGLSEVQRFYDHCRASEEREVD